MTHMPDPRRAFTDRDGDGDGDGDGAIHDRINELQSSVIATNRRRYPLTVDAWVVVTPPRSRFRDCDDTIGQLD